MPPVMMILEHILPIGAVITLLTLKDGRVMLFHVTAQDLSTRKSLATALMSANKIAVGSIRTSLSSRTSRSGNRDSYDDLRAHIRRDLVGTIIFISKFIVLVATVKGWLEPASHNRCSYGDLRARIRQDLVGKFILYVSPPLMFSEVILVIGFIITILTL